MKRREFLINTATLAGAAVPLAGYAQSRPCPPPTDNATGGGSTTTTCANGSSDWQTRISGAGVVWYHGFDSDAEMNQFRWVGSYGGGNDPTASSADASYLIRSTSGGPGGAPYIQFTRPASREANVNWWRPFSAFAAPGNGRTTNDPAAGKPLRTWAPTSQGSQTNGWAQDWYGPSTYQQPFYVQIRIMTDLVRYTSPYTSVTSVGKLFYLSTTTKTLTSQEVVTYSGTQLHRAYVGGSPPLESIDTLRRPGQQVGGQLSHYPSPYCDVGSDPGLCWGFSGGWDTLLYVLTPGTQTSGTVTSGIQIYAANQGVTTYTKIWDEQFTHGWDQTNQYGWNAICMNTYQNNSVFPGSFWQRYAQIIFSTQMIPCPLV